MASTASAARWAELGELPFPNGSGHRSTRRLFLSPCRALNLRRFRIRGTTAAAPMSVRTEGRICSSSPALAGLQVPAPRR